MDQGTPRNPAGGPRRQATVLESVEEIRAQVRASSSAAKAAAEGATSPAEDPAQDTRPYRPTMRPPMGLLCVLDDGDDSGELVRIRAGTFVIGRVEGDLVIPHDAGMSGRHAEISRRVEDGQVGWYLRDLQSTNGTFVRASTVVLNPDQELLIGGRRFRFEATAPSPIATATTEALPNPAAAPPPASSQGATQKWEALPARDAGAPPPPVLVEISQGRQSRRFPLRDPENWLGRDSRACSIVVDDPMIDRRHARIYRDERSNRWIIANARSRNGIWARVQEVGLGRGGFFQCGEQRFSFKVL